MQFAIKRYSKFRIIIIIIKKSLYILMSNISKSIQILSPHTKIEFILLMLVRINMSSMMYQNIKVNEMKETQVILQM